MSSTVDYSEMVRIASREGLIKNVPEWNFEISDSARKDLERLIGRKMPQISKGVVDHVFGVIQDQFIPVEDFIVEAVYHLAATEPRLRNWTAKKFSGYSPTLYLGLVASMAKDYAKKNGLIHERGYAVSRC